MSIDGHHFAYDVYYHSVIVFDVGRLSTFVLFDQWILTQLSTQ